MRKIFVSWTVVAAGLLLGGCTGSSPKFTLSRPSQAAAPATASTAATGATEEGVASYYAHEFNGRTTANGETYDMHGLTAAHRTLPFNTKVLVTNRTNGKSVTVRINDRGPFKDDRIIDLSLEAAKAIDMIGPGTAAVNVEVLAPDPKR